MTIEKFSFKDVTARLATNNDLSAMLEIEQSAFEQKRWATEASLKKRLGLGGSATWLAFIKDKAVGFTNGFPIFDLKTQEELDPDDSLLHQEGSKVWLLRNMAVRPEYQGRAVGKILFQKQIESAAAYGTKTVRFTTTKEYSSSLSAIGFRLISEPKEFHGVLQGVWDLALS